MMIRPFPLVKWSVSHFSRSEMGHFWQHGGHFTTSFRLLWSRNQLGSALSCLPTDQTRPSRNSAQLCWVDTNICERDIVVNVTSLVEFQKMSHYKFDPDNLIQIAPDLIQVIKVYQLDHLSLIISKNSKYSKYSKYWKYSKYSKYSK